MKLIIDIPEEVYKNIQSKSKEIQTEGYTVENAVLNGTPFDDITGTWIEIDKECMLVAFVLIVFPLFPKIIG